MPREPIPDECNRLYFEGIQAERQYRFIEAEQKFEEAQSCFEKHENWTGVGRMLVHRARIRRHQGKFQEALDFIHKALETLHQTRGRLDCDSLAMLYNDWGNICNKLGQYEEAKKHFLRSIGLAKGHLFFLQSDQFAPKMAQDRKVETILECRDCEASIALTLLNLSNIALTEAYKEAFMRAKVTRFQKKTQMQILADEQHLWEKPWALVRMAKDIALRLYEEEKGEESVSDRCALCSRQPYSDAQLGSGWYCILRNGKRVYLCPTCFSNESQVRSLKEASITWVRRRGHAAELGAALGHMAEIKANRAKILWSVGQDEEGDRQLEQALALAQQSIFHLEEGGAKSETYFAMQELFQIKRYRELAKKWAIEGIRERYRRLPKVPWKAVLDWVPRWLDLENLDAKIENGEPLDIPAIEAWRRLFLTALFLSECGYRDKEYKYLARAIEIIETMQTHAIADPISCEADFLIATDELKRNLVRHEMEAVYNLMIRLLLSPYGHDATSKDCVAEAFYYCERAKSRAFLDLMVARRSNIEQTVTAQGLNRAALAEQLRGQVLALKEVQDSLREFAPRSALIEYYLDDDDLLAIFTVTEDSAEVSCVSEYWREVSGFDRSKIIARQVIKPVEASAIRFAVWKFCRDISHTEIPVEGGDSDLPRDTVKRVQAIWPNQKAGSFGIPFQCDLNVIKHQGQWLYERLIRPTEHAWTKDGKPIVDRLIIIPTGRLHHLPFGALFDGGRFLIEKVPVVQAPSASVLVECYRRRPKLEYALNSRESYLGVANPRGYPDEKDLKGRRGTYGCIPGCEKTIASVAHYFDQSFNALAFDPQCSYPQPCECKCSFLSYASADGRVRLFRREAASKAQFLRYHDKYSFVDIHSHGEYNEDEPLQSQILFVGEDGKEDWLRALDGFKIKFGSQLKLLTLGCCFAGETEVERADELIGMIRAFFYAGARSILACRWLVDDEAATELINRFYDGRRGGLIRDGYIVTSKDKALQNAQVHMIQQGRNGRRTHPVLPTWEHPFYWAWTLLGDHTD